MNTLNTLFEKATYNPEDNKLRLFLATEERLPDELYQEVKSHGFVYAPVQKLYVAPGWRPDREDFCLKLVNKIVADGTTLAERAEAKAARLDALAEKRANEAIGFKAAAHRLAQNLVYGQPILVGHHSERKAQRNQDKLNSFEKKYSELADATDYWVSRAVGVERHANRKNNSSTRLNRMKKLLTDLRKFQRNLNHGEFVAGLWTNLSKQKDEAIKLKNLVNYSGIYFKGGPLTPKHIGQKVDANEVTLNEAYELCIEFGNKLANNEWDIRFIQHILNRLAYEQQELGWEVQRYDGKLTAAILQTFVRTHGGDTPKARKVENSWALKTLELLPIHIGQGKELECSEEEWKNLMVSVGYEVPAVKPKKPSILNIDIEALSIPKLYETSLQVLKVIKMSKAEFAEMHKDSKGIKYSSCGQFRVRVCRDPNPEVAYFKKGLFAVFLTDSLKHEIPNSNSIVSQAEAEAA